HHPTPGGAFHHPRGDVDVDPEPVRADVLWPPGVHPDPHPRRVAIDLNGFHRVLGGQRGPDGGNRLGEHHHRPVPHPLDDAAARSARAPDPVAMPPPAASSGGSTTWATRRSSRRVASSPAFNAHDEKPTRSVKTRVTSGLAGRPEIRSVSACHTCSVARLTSRVAASRSSSRPAARATTLGPSPPATDSGSP